MLNIALLALLAAEYLDPAALSAALRDLERADPTRAQVTSIGTSGEGREILLLTLGPREGADERPALLLLGSPHGEELLGQEAALACARALLAPEHAELLAKRTVYVIPQPNPDAAARALASPAVRLAATPLPAWDEDGDFAADEDPPRDVDGDGVIAWMRIRDPRGTWIADPEVVSRTGDVRYLRPADPARGEHGIWRVVPEGLDADGDEAIAEDGPGGIDLDRSFPMFYRPAHELRAAGPYQLAAPEGWALAELLAARKNIVAARIFHTAGGRGPMGDDPHPLASGEGGDLPAADKKLFEDLEKAWRESPGHDGAAGAFDRPEGSAAHGALQDHLVHALGIVALSHRLWDRAPGYTPNPNTPTARVDALLQWLRWADRELGAGAGEAGFIPWRPFRHPTLGDVEIGGWRPRTRETPPDALVEERAAREVPFTLDLLARFPEIAIESVTATALATDVFQIDLAVRNAGRMPTAPEIARRAQRAPDPVVELSLPEGAAVIFGRARTQVPHLAPGGRAEVRWVVRAKAGARVRVRAWATRAGEDAREIGL